MPPILVEANQPHDFQDVLFPIEMQFLWQKLSWYSPKIISFIYRLHHEWGYTPPNEEAAVMALSYSQLCELLKRLEGLR